MGIILLLPAAILGFLTFQLAVGMNWHIAVALILALVPIAATFFMGVFGFVGGAMFVGMMYRASSAG